MCELGAVMCLKWFKSEIRDVLQRELIDIFVYWKVLHEQWKHRQRQNTPLQNAAVLFFNPLCPSPLKLVWCNKTRGYKTNKNFLWFDTQKFRQGWLFFWFGTKTFPIEFSLLWCSMRILFLLLKTLHLKLCSYVYEFECKFRII